MVLVVAQRRRRLRIRLLDSEARTLAAASWAGRRIRTERILPPHDVTYLRSALSTRRSATSAAKPVFRNDVARSTLVYQFTRALSLRAIVDYNAVVPDASLVRLATDARVGLDTLFTYQVGPSTALYLGYASGFQNLALVDGSPATRVGSPGTEAGRQVLLKLSYLVRR